MMDFASMLVAVLVRVIKDASRPLTSFQRGPRDDFINRVAKGCW